jgi:hypothetical protein
MKSNPTEKGGMSRAAQNKRKRHEKKKKVFNLNSSVMQTVEKKNFQPYRDDDDDDEEDGDTLDIGSNYSEDNNDEYMFNKKSKNIIDDKDKFDEEIVASLFEPSKSSESAVYLNKIKEYTVSKILALKDVEDITAQDRADVLLSMLIFPMKLQLFNKDISRKIPYHFSLSSSSERKQFGFHKMFSKLKFKNLCKETLLNLHEDIDIFVNDSTEPLVMEDDAENSQSESLQWLKYYEQGNALSLVQPQKYDDFLWSFFSALEFQFNSAIVGNIVLLPLFHVFHHQALQCDSFIIQLEGSSKVCFSSLTTMNSVSNGDDENSEHRVSVSEVAMKTSDVFYVPSGYPIKIQAITPVVNGSASSKSINDNKYGHGLVMIIKTNKKNSISDVLEVALPVAIQNLKIQSSSSFLNEMLTSNCRSFLGVAHSENDENHNRSVFYKILRKTMETISTELLEIFDPAFDQHTKNFIMERLPVPLTEDEELLTGVGTPNAVIHPYTQLRTIRPGVAVAVVEEGKVVVYHCLDNSRETFGSPINPLEFEVDDGPAIETLLNAYPGSITVEELEHPSDEIDDKVAIVQALYKEGLLVITDAASQPAEFGNRNDNDSNASDSDGLL